MEGGGSNKGTEELEPSLLQTKEILSEEKEP
jgi:hypothetical protein